MLLFAQEKDSIRVFYLGGQSNMIGFGTINELPSDLNKEFKNVFMYEGNSVGDEQQHGGIGKWEVLKPGYGIGFSTDGIKNNYSNRFGIELSFAKNTKE